MSSLFFLIKYSALSEAFDTCGGAPRQVLIVIFASIGKLPRSRSPADFRQRREQPPAALHDHQSSLDDSLLQAGTSGHDTPAVNHL